jgi:hypothetical protein
MVFEERVAPRTQREFDEWCDQQTEWSESHSYDDPSISSPALKGWFEEMRRAFPPMNGPFALSDEEFAKLSRDAESRITDYSIGKTVIYTAFGWSVADEAEKTVRRLAQKHGLGFYHPGSGEVLFPGDKRRFGLTSNRGNKRGASWEDVWLALKHLKEGKGEFATIEEQPPTGHGLYMQVIYEKDHYHVEIQLVDSDKDLGMPQYSCEFTDLSLVIKTFRDWYIWSELPDLTVWNDAKIAPPMADRKNERINTIVTVLIVIVGAAIIVGGIAYIVMDFLSLG